MRDEQGRFAKGNPGGPGNPYSRRTSALRNALYDAVSAEDLKTIVCALVAKAKKGDTVAAREVIDRLLGKPEPVDLIARLEGLEQALVRNKESNRGTFGANIAGRSGTGINPVS